MKWAIIKNERVQASPGKTAICPLCKEEVISKCGDIKIWHWAHKINTNCYEGYENETAWHRNWKDNFPEENQEIIDGKHRADVKINDLILEFQNSPIKESDIISREKQYKKMYWILNGRTYALNFIFKHLNRTIFFKWRWPSKSWFCSKSQLFIDLSDMVDLLTQRLDKLKKEEEKLRIINNTDPSKDLIITIGEEYEFYNDYGEFIEIDNTKVINHTQLLRDLELDIARCKDSILKVDILNKQTPCYGWGYIISKEEFIRRVKDGRGFN